LQIIKKKLREEMTTLKNSRILLVLLLIITVVASTGCARYGGNPARYDYDGARGNYIDQYNNPTHGAINYNQ